MSGRRIHQTARAAPGFLRLAYDYVPELIKTVFHAVVEPVIPNEDHAWPWLLCTA